MSERLGTELILQMIFAVRCTAADILLRLLLLKAASSIEEKKYQSRVTNGVHSLVTFDWCYYHEKSSNKKLEIDGCNKVEEIFRLSICTSGRNWHEIARSERNQLSFESIIRDLIDICRSLRSFGEAQFDHRRKLLNAWHPWIWDRKWLHSNRMILNVFLIGRSGAGVKVRLCNFYLDLGSWFVVLYALGFKFNWFGKYLSSQCASPRFYR